jgi:hypothetical protein
LPITNANLHPDCDGNSHAYTYSDAYRKCPTFSNTNGYCHRDCDCDSYAYANIDAYGYAYCDRDAYTAAYSVTKGYSGAKASADSSAAPRLGHLGGAIAD